MKDRDSLVFYSKSADKKPGRGVGSGWRERVVDPNIYKKLAAIKNWRKMLSNFWEAPFVLDGEVWNSVEHFFHAAKFRDQYPDYYKTFTLDSGSEWSKNCALAKSYGKAGRSKTTNKRLKIAADIKMRPDFYDGIDEKAMILAQYSKFSQNEDLRKMLLATGDAKLYHLVTVRGQSSKLQRWHNLEKIRRCLRKIPEVVIFRENVVSDIL